MDLQGKAALAIYDVMDVQDGLDPEAAQKYARAILNLPEIKEALELLEVSGPMQTAHRYLLIGEDGAAFRVIDKFLAAHFKTGLKDLGKLGQDWEASP